MLRGRDDDEEATAHDPKATVPPSRGGVVPSHHPGIGSIPSNHVGASAVIPSSSSSPGGGGGAAPTAAAAAVPGSNVNPYTGHPYSSHYFTLQKTRHLLPMWDKREAIQKHIADYQITLLVGETGSGKTTQLPQFVMEMKPKGKIACTQPRRVAAMSVATRVAEEMDVRCGNEVGFSVRFQRQVSENTKIVYMTDGMLLREAQGDPNLTQYSVIVIDEAHERAVDTDILLGVVKLLCARRHDLRVVVMSATLDMQKFQTYFANAPLLKVPGRMFHVHTYYTQQPVRDYVESAIDHVVNIHVTEPPGDILVFLIGEAEIERAVAKAFDRIERETASSAKADLMRAKVLPLYGSLSLENQKRVFFPAEPNTRKIIFSTNIAETSVTIDGVVYVVDSGYHKQTLYDAKVRIDSLLPAVISKAAAEQRKGRAGRTRAGKCYRLFCEKDFATLPDQTYPEVLRSNMIQTVLTLHRLNVENPCMFPFVDPPSHQSFMDAYMQLVYYGALDDEGTLTEFGKVMADLPVEPHVARMLIKSSQFGCSADVCVIAAMLEVGNVFLRPPRRQGEADQQRKKFEHPDGDHLTLFNVFHAFLENHHSPGRMDAYCLKSTALSQAHKIYQQLVTIMQRKELRVVSAYNMETKEIDSARVRRALLEGYFTQVAYLPPGADRYRTVREKQAAYPHSQSVISKSKPTWVMYDRLEIQGKDGCFLRQGSVVDPMWLHDVHAEFFDPNEIEDGAIATEVKSILLRREQLQLQQQQQPPQ